MTPRELWIWSTACRDRIRCETKARHADIYSLASLIRSMVWAKHPPRFERVFPEDVRPKRMTDEQMKEQVLALNAALGGRIVEA